MIALAKPYAYRNRTVLGIKSPWVAAGPRSCGGRETQYVNSPNCQMWFLGKVTAQIYVSILSGAFYEELGFLPDKFHFFAFWQVKKRFSKMEMFSIS